MATYHWTIDSAIWQIRNGEPGKARESAYAWLADKIENGSAAETTEIARKLFDAVATLVGGKK